MFEKNEIKKGVIIGIIGAFCFALLTFLGDIFFSIASKIFVNYNNQLYQRIALRDYNLDIKIYYYLFILFITTIFFITIFSLVKYKMLIGELKNLKKRIPNNEIKYDDKPINELIQENNNLKEKINKEIVNGNKWFKIFSLLFIINITYFFISGISGFSTEIIIKRKIAEYENTKRIIAPYISEQEEELFESKFVQIKNEQDYFNLRDEMNELLLEKGLLIIWKEK